jgi:hypothetical protein
MSASKRPSTSSLRRFITSRPYVTVAELRRRFGLDDPDAMAHIARNGTSAWIGLPEREAAKLQELWHRDELGMELSVEVRAPVVVGIYPMRIARYVMQNGTGVPASSTGNAATTPHPRNGGISDGRSGPGNWVADEGHSAWMRGSPADRPAEIAPRPLNGAHYGSSPQPLQRD